jgi:hypothetical protein
MKKAIYIIISIILLTLVSSCGSTKHCDAYGSIESDTTTQTS